MAGVESEPVAYTLVELSEVDSTNNEAMRRAAQGERGPIWILAGLQTAGRGRSGRSWTSTRGNLALSLLFEPGCEPRDLPQLSLLVGVAVHEAV
ncbi:MAG: biotin--[acetyl-CoA-carboxylase] ligase, partial [Hyphomicrobium sp.]